MALSNINEAIKKLKSNCTCKYAQAYLEALPSAIDEAGTDGLCVQLLYVLENCKTWTGDEARETKKFIRSWITKKNKKL
jgi:hypothetical protein